MRGAASISITSALLTLAGCGGGPKPGVTDLPPLPRYKPGVFTDINPRWSHDGKRIAYLRAMPDRRLQLYVTDDDVERTTALLEAETVSPDRPYDSQLRRYSSPDTLSWSPDDHHIAFERAEWFQFDDGQRLPGTGIWSFDLRSGRVAPLALHPKRYTNLYYFYHTPAWSPDGKYVSFIAEGINGQRLIGLRCTAVEKPKEVAPRFDNYACSDWATWRTGTRYARKAVDPQPVLTYFQGIFKSPNIPMTATLRSIQPGSTDGSECRELWRMTPAQYAVTSSVRARTIEGDVVEPRIGQPVWSRDGSRIAFTLTPDPTDYSRYELWVFDARRGSALRVSPTGRRGYVAPVWIDERRLGALSPNKDKFDVVSIDIAGRSSRILGSIETADCDWSPDRTRIVYAAPASSRADGSDDVSTLRFLETHIRAVALRRSRPVRL